VVLSAMLVTSLRFVLCPARRYLITAALDPPLRRDCSAGDCPGDKALFSLPNFLRRKRPITDDADLETVTTLEPPLPRPSLIGYLGERSTRHVAGWLHNPGAPDERVEFEVLCTLPGAERVIARSRASLYNRALELLGIGDASYGFRLLFPEIVTEAERDHVEIYPIATGLPLQHDPNMRTRWEPIRFVAMDIVDNCNLRCPFCLWDYSNVHTTHVMSDEVYEKALGLLPLVGAEQFWLSCLHEPTMHPKLTEFITHIPREYRDNVFYTTNLARRMQASYYETLADSGLHHINISIESRDPEIYERMRKGARHRIFIESWNTLLRACAQGSAPPRLHYIILAYKSNLAEIPELVEYLRNERRATTIEVRFTFDMPHIPAEFKQAEYIAEDDWMWLQQRLARYTVGEVTLSLPPALVSATRIPIKPESRSVRLDGMFEVRLSYDGTMSICPALAGESPQGRSDHVHVNIKNIGDPATFLMTLWMSKL
jgi:molybdenum cofactor biosynthesis enzyme MoaA